MLKFIRAWSPRTEATIVILLAFGYFILASVLALAGLITPSFSESELLQMVIFESMFLLILASFLHLRGWTLERFGLIPARTDPLVGVGLMVVVWLPTLLLWFLAKGLQMEPTYLGGAESMPVGSLSVPVVVLASLINGLYEELFVCAYPVALAKEHDKAVLGINMSVAIRLSYHLYQGGIGVIEIIPFGMVCAWWYARTGRLWPVVVAHALTDFVGLSQYIK